MAFVTVSENIFSTKYLFYHPFYRRTTLRACRIAKEVLVHLQDMMSLPTNQKIVMRSLPRHVLGGFAFVSQSIELEPRRGNWFDFIETLCHECVHSEQYYENRTAFQFLDDRFYMRYGDELFQCDDSTISDKATPWEQEAYERQGNLAREVCLRMIKEGTDAFKPSEVGMH